MEDQIFQIITLAFVLVGFVLEVYQAVTESKENYWSFSHALWMTHALFFYIFITLDRYTTLEIKPVFGSYTLWSSVLRLHIVATFVILEWARIRQAELRKIKRQLLDELILTKDSEIQRLTTENKILVTSLEHFSNKKGVPE